MKKKSSSDTRMDLDLPTRSGVYRPQYANMVYLRQVGSDYRKAVVDPASYLLANPDVRQLGGLDVDAVGMDPVERQRLLEVLANLTGKVDDSTINTTLRSFNPDLPPNAVAYLRAGGKDLNVRALDELFAGDHDQVLSVAMDRVEARTALHLPGALRLSERGTDPALVRLQHLGIEDLVYVEDFPMLLACLGYKRVPKNETTQDAEFVTFPKVGDRRDKYPLFVEPYNTEALIFELDGNRVVDFIEDRLGIQVPQIENLPKSFAMGALASIHRTKAREKLDSGIRWHDELGAAAWTLMHTISHAAIKAAAGLSGFNLTSLAEYVLPGSLRFAITINRTQENGIGGLHSMFQDQLDSFVNRFESIHKDCLHDPSCMSLRAACHACLTISETSCRHMNAYLDRRILYGETNRKGFYAWRAPT